MGLPWCDHHCHLADETWEQDVVEAEGTGLCFVLDVGVDEVTSAAAVRRAEARPGFVWATAGVHPHEASAGLGSIAELLRHPRVVAVGECGLDYHYEHSPRDVQRDVFCRQLELARSFRLPVVIHCREAFEDTLAILREVGLPERGAVLHCFTGDRSEARRCLDLGLHLSFSGIVTFPSAGALREVAAWCPAERLLVETDSPYLTPVPLRGRRNTPSKVDLVGRAVAAARGIDPAELARLTTSNASRLYGIRLPSSCGDAI